MSVTQTAPSVLSRTIGGEGMLMALDTLTARTATASARFVDLFDAAPPRLELDAPELEALILAADERLETAADDERDALRAGRHALELELHRILSAHGARR